MLFRFFFLCRRQENSRESFDSDQPSKLLSADEEEADTDLETDRLLGQQRLDDQGFYDEKVGSHTQFSPPPCFYPHFSYLRKIFTL